MGEDGYKRLLEERKVLFSEVVQRLGEFAASVGERVLTTPHNPISIGITLSKVAEPTALGSMLFARCVSGI